MFGKKDDPLVGVISGIVNNTARKNEVERKVNETFGVHSRKALPHERLAEYDAALAAAQSKPQNLSEEEQIDEVLDTDKKKMAYVKKAIQSKDRNQRKADAAYLRSDEFLDSAGEPDYNPKRPNRWGTNVDIEARARRKVANRKKGLERALKEAKWKAGREYEMDKAQEKEDEVRKTAKEWEKYWREHGNKSMADFSERARKKKLKESRAEREAARDDYKYKITGSDKEKEKKIKERIAKTTGYKFKKKD